MNEKIVTSIVFAVAVVILVSTLYFAYSFEKKVEAGASPSVLSECGDITDTSNVQHLSHHPDKYAACIKLVDPTIFKAAVGTDKAEFMQKNGIQ